MCFGPRSTCHDNRGVVVNVFYKHSRIKQYLKDGRAMCTETVVNAPATWAVTPGCPTSTSCRHAPVRASAGSWMLNGSAVGCAPASPGFERIAYRTVAAAGRRTPTLRFRHPRVMAPGRRLVHHPARGDRLRQQERARLVGGLLGTSLQPGAMTYDLRRLRLNGMIRRIEHTNRYVLTPYGSASSSSASKLFNRLLVPLIAANLPQAPPELEDCPSKPSPATSTPTWTAPTSRKRPETDTTFKNPATNGTLVAPGQHERRRTVSISLGRAQSGLWGAEPLEELGRAAVTAVEVCHRHSRSSTLNSLNTLFVPSNPW